MLADSGLVNNLQRYGFDTNGRPMCIYGDPAYIHRIHLQRPYANAGLTPQMQAFDTWMKYHTHLSTEFLVILLNHTEMKQFYADDTQVYVIMNAGNRASCVETLEACANDIKLWSTHNDLVMNDSKTDVVHIFVQLCSSQFAVDLWIPNEVLWIWMFCLTIISTSSLI